MRLKACCFRHQQGAASTTQTAQPGYDQSGYNQAGGDRDRDLVEGSLAGAGVAGAGLAAADGRDRNTVGNEQTGHLRTV